MLDPKPITIQINGYHAHVYYNTETKPTAERLAEAISKKFAVKFGGSATVRLARIQLRTFRSFSPPQSLRTSCRG